MFAVSKDSVCLLLGAAREGKKLKMRGPRRSSQGNLLWPRNDSTVMRQARAYPGSSAMVHVLDRKNVTSFCPKNNFGLEIPKIFSNAFIFLRKIKYMCH
jgi:hypothetical protein